MQSNLASFFCLWGGFGVFGLSSDHFGSERRLMGSFFCEKKSSEILQPIKCVGLVQNLEPKFYQTPKRPNLVLLHTSALYESIYRFQTVAGYDGNIGDTLHIDLSTTTAYCSWHGWDTAPVHQPPRGRSPVYRGCCGGPTAALSKVNSSP